MYELCCLVSSGIISNSTYRKLSSPPATYLSSRSRSRTHAHGHEHGRRQRPSSVRSRLLSIPSLLRI